jgi:hypothetical protein
VEVGTGDGLYGLGVLLKSVLKRSCDVLIEPYEVLVGVGHAFEDEVSAPHGPTFFLVLDDVMRLLLNVRMNELLANFPVGLNQRQGKLVPGKFTENIQNESQSKTRLFQLRILDLFDGELVLLDLQVDRLDCFVYSANQIAVVLKFYQERLG